MTSFILRLATFAGKNWLRLLLIGCALLLLTQKQVNLNFRLGYPNGTPASREHIVPPAEPRMERTEPAILSEETTADKTPEASGESLLSRFNIFGRTEATHFETLEQLDETRVEAFVTRFSNVAQAEQEKFGVPASIILATGLLYSRAGTASASQELNNFFGLGCQQWSGDTGRVGGQCLRRYANAWTSFRDFCLYASSGKYEVMTQFGPNDYRRWAQGLEELGYNETEDLAQQLQQTIDRWQLFRFD